MHPVPFPELFKFEAQGMIARGEFFPNIIFQPDFLRGEEGV